MRRLRHSRERGAIYVETLIAFPIVLYFGLVTWQLVDWMTANLIAQRAAQIAARSASTVGPDDTYYMDGQAKDLVNEGPRNELIRDAAWRVLAAHPRFEKAGFDLEINGAQNDAMVHVTLRSTYTCELPGLNAVCGGQSSRRIETYGRFPYQNGNIDWDL